ncbi:MAG: hypothetical protein AAF629_12070 [Chloroflexota bacterium]
MGNQREIRQVLPIPQLGVALTIHTTDEEMVANILSQHPDAHFYTHIAQKNEPAIIHNMDFDATPLAISNRDRLIIKSGGKMWCGYDAFCEHIRTIAPYLEDGLFFVGDEEDYIDEFLISNGKLTYTRVHSGYWWDLEDYLKTRF